MNGCEILKYNIWIVLDESSHLVHFIRLHNSWGVKSFNRHVNLPTKLSLKKEYQLSDWFYNYSQLYNF